MSEEYRQEDNAETPLLTLLQQIKDGVLNTKLIDKQTRKELVRLLRGEGYTQYHIAQIFDCSEKTVYRDIKEIEKENSLSTSPEFAKQVIGEMVNAARQHWAALTRIARSPGMLPQGRISAEVSAWGVIVGLIEKLQSLGYLPMMPKEVIGDFSHHVTTESKEPTFTEIKAMLLEIETVSKDATSQNPELSAEIAQLMTRIEKAEITEQIKKLSDNQQNTQKGESNGQ